MSKSSELPECYGIEWNPLETEACGRCRVAEHCTRVFAREHLTTVAHRLGVSNPQEVTPERLAAECNTSVEAIQQALLLRFRSAQEPTPDAPTPAPIEPAAPGVEVSSPVALSAAPSAPTATPDAPPAPASPKRRGRPPGAKSKATAPQPATPAAVEAPAPTEPKPRSIKVDCPTCHGDGHHACPGCAGAGLISASRYEEITGRWPKLPDMVEVVEVPGPEPEPEAPEVDPEASGVGFSINLTSGEVGHVTWPGFPPLFETPGTAPVFQLTYWSQPLASWVSLVAEPSGRPPIAGVVELTWRQVMDSGFQQKLGAAPGAALRSVLGI